MRPLLFVSHTHVHGPGDLLLVTFDRHWHPELAGFARVPGGPAFSSYHAMRNGGLGGRASPLLLPVNRGAFSRLTTLSFGPIGLVPGAR